MLSGLNQIVVLATSGQTGYRFHYSFSRSCSALPPLVLLHQEALRLQTLYGCLSRAKSACTACEKHG